MKVDQQDIEYIRKKFAQMQRKEDFVALLSEAKTMLYKEECKPYELKSITYYANPKINRKRYQAFTIKKKSGANRVIHAPVNGLKSILRTLNFVLQCLHKPHEAATGFVLNKSIVDNARKHVGSHYVYNLDLKDFFPSVEAGRLRARLKHPPFDLTGAERSKIGNLITWLCCEEMEVERPNEDGDWIKVSRNVLPQGAPTSPTITNIICERLDFCLNGFAKKYNLNYSRYADDITFSSMHNIYQTDSSLVKKIHQIIQEQHFHIKEPKTRLQKNVYRQETTGLIVNEKVNVRRRYVKQIRMWLYYWEKYGYDKAQAIFTRDYIADKGHVKNQKPTLVNVLDGKLEFLKMVKGDEDGTYTGLRNRFLKLNPGNHSIYSVLELWEKEGIEKAMEAFYQNN